MSELMSRLLQDQNHLYTYTERPREMVLGNLDDIQLSQAKEYCAGQSLKSHERAES